MSLSNAPEAWYFASSSASFSCAFSRESLSKRSPPGPKKPLQASTASSPSFPSPSATPRRSCAPRRSDDQVVRGDRQRQDGAGVRDDPADDTHGGHENQRFDEPANLRHLAEERRSTPFESTSSSSDVSVCGSRETRTFPGVWTTPCLRRIDTPLPHRTATRKSYIYYI